MSVYDEQFERWHRRLARIVRASADERLRPRMEARFQKALEDMWAEQCFLTVTTVEDCGCCDGDVLTLVRFTPKSTGNALYWAFTWAELRTPVRKRHLA